MKEKLGVKQYYTNFYGRRALRIFPLYYLYLLVTLVICLVIVNGKNYVGVDRIDRFLEQLPWGLSYTYNFYHATKYFEHSHLITHFWSLAVEEQFYLLWPLLIMLVSPRRTKLLLLAIILFGPLVRLATSLVVESNLFPTISKQLDLVVYVLPFSHFDAFATGGLFSLFIDSELIGGFAWPIILVGLALGYLSSYLTSGSVQIHTLGWPPFMADARKYIWGYSVINLVVATMLVQIREGRFLKFIFDNRVAVYLGRISYGLYIIHLPAIWWVGYLYPDLSPVPKAAVILTATVLLSALSYELMEKRIISLKDSLFPTRPASRSADGNDLLISGVTSRGASG